MQEYIVLRHSMITITKKTYTVYDIFILYLYIPKGIIKITTECEVSSCLLKLHQSHGGLLLQRRVERQSIVQTHRIYLL